MRVWITSVICLAASAAEPCLVVEGDRFSAGELAKVAPLFAQADPAAPAGYTPAPGIQRLLRRPEMESMARQPEAAERARDGVLRESLRDRSDHTRRSGAVPDSRARRGFPRGGVSTVLAARHAAIGRIAGGCAHDF